MVFRKTWHLRKLRHWEAHLVLTALWAVAVEAQCLVGRELLDARVDGGTDSNTNRENKSTKEFFRFLLSRGQRQEKEKLDSYSSHHAGKWCQNDTYPKTMPKIDCTESETLCFL